MEKGKFRIEVYSKIEDSRGKVLVKKFQDSGYSIDNIRVTDNYILNYGLDNNQVEEVATAVTQGVTQGYLINDPYVPENYNYAVEIGFLPGVTDNVAHTVTDIIEDLYGKQDHTEARVFTSKTYFFTGNLSEEDMKKIAYELYNPLIEREKILTDKEYATEGMGLNIPVVSINEEIKADKVSLDISEEELLKIGKEGIADADGTRRGPLALDGDSLKVIKDYFDNVEKREPTDIELESIAQTWSEHCKHTIFAAKLDDDERGLFKSYIYDATMKIRKDKGDDDICLSIFGDNAGGIEFDDNWIISDKVETHNSPSALDPFGGSITGIVGVNRDEVGFAMGAKPVANRYGFCFADPDDKEPLYRAKDKDTKLLSPERIMEGVIQGVNVGGNQSGIPTPQGFVYFDKRYKGKPLVFVGTIGLIPKIVNGKTSVEKSAQNGDAVVVVGGRVGRDGIHGATFSSEALTSGSPAGAVQIGDPITQKKLSDAIVKEARDLNLYNSITDNGAGGISCSVAEMAKESGGFVVDLEKVPLKYPGLSPWQIWVSESQERMTLSVPQNKVDEFIKLMEKRGVEATVIGTFNDSDRAVVKYDGEVIFDLEMDFLHDGLPKKELKTVYKKGSFPYPEFADEKDGTRDLENMLSRLNNASFEFISTQYDHEVQANSVVKPLHGKGRVNGNASVVRPVLDSKKGVVLSQGMFPSYSEIDSYNMAACSIDTAVRNAIAVGGTMKSMALLDNFCWCDSTNPERLGQLKEAAKACYDYAVAYGAPYVSGKDSMFNDFKGYDKDFNEVKISVPPTLLISSIGVMPDVYKSQTMDFKKSGDLIYILGKTEDEMGGSEFLAYKGEQNSGEAYLGESIPSVDAEKNLKFYQTFEKAMADDLVASSVSVERGGFILALAKSSMAGQLGTDVDLNKLPADNINRNDTMLYSETQGRILVSINPENREKFESLFAEIDFALIGEVKEDNKFLVKGLDGNNVIESTVDAMADSYKSRFKNYQEM